MFKALDSVGYEFTAPFVCRYIKAGDPIDMSRPLHSGSGVAFHNPIHFSCSRSGRAYLSKCWTDTAPSLSPSLPPSDWPTIDAVMCSRLIPSVFTILLYYSFVLKRFAQVQCRMRDCCYEVRLMALIEFLDYRMYCVMFERITFNSATVPPSPAPSVPYDIIRL